MSKIGKNALASGNFHLKPVPEEFLNRVKPERRGQAQGKNVWLKTLEKQGEAAGLPSLKDRVATLQGKEGATTSFVALNILFPESIFGKMMKVKKMPETTLEEKAEKESAFRKLLLEQFDIHEVRRDMNCGLRAIVCGLNPDLENNAEEITAFILRGDLIDYVKKHPELIEGGSDPKVLQDYCSAMATRDLPIGIKEMRIMSELLESPIHIYRFDDAQMDAEHKICSGNKSTFGSESHGSKRPISIYFDPNRRQFMPLFPKKQSKFGILNLG